MATTTLGTQVKLYIKASALADTDVLSKSDPYCVLMSVANGSVQPPPAGARPGPGLAIIGRTETIRDNLYPSWKTTFDVPFLFEAKQTFRIAVFDDDGKGPMGDDPLGQVDFDLSTIMCSINMTKVFRLHPRGELIVSGVEVNSNTRDSIALRFRGDRMKKMDTFSDSDCYFFLRRSLPGGQTRDIYKSEVKHDTLKPLWRDVKFPVSELTGNNLDEETIEFHCWDEDATSDEDMGKFRCSFNQLLQHCQTKTPFKVVKIKPDKVKEYGDIYIDQALIQHRPTFPEFLQNGAQMNLAISIDFTGSNGDPRTPTSLHYMDPSRPNQYLSAIMSVGDILVQYDSDKQIPVFGFGAGFNGVPNHFFNVNGQQSPYVNNVQGVIDAYGAFLPTCTLWGPTNFAPTIRAISDGCKGHHQQAMSGGPIVYTVLLIITDGAITDVNETIAAIVAADALPLSIVIVGVGNADFSMMDMLDGDGCALRDFTGRVSRRDLVQFVPFLQFQGQPREALAAAVLKEVPPQVERYAELNGIKPRPPPTAAAAAAVVGGAGPAVVAVKTGAPAGFDEVNCPIPPPPQKAKQ